MTRKRQTFGAQTELPSLPVPSLQETGARLLASVEPLSQGTEDLACFEALVKDFSKTGGQGSILQSRLLTRQKEFQEKGKSWLEDWWLSLAYLSWRSPVLVHSNWYILAQPHPDAGKGLASLQTTRAAGFISNFLNYKDVLDA
jgi:carnitine O-acetyltransferase